MNNTLPSAWLAVLDANANASLARATAAAQREAATGKHIFPSRADWFAAFHHVAPSYVRVVILGQDPYPTRGNAMGLAFSVPRGVRPPASLKNIYKSIHHDLGIPPASHGDLRNWAAQGVLLLNSVLTVEEGLPGSHAEFGWHELTDAVIAALGSEHQPPKAFLLWGAQAQKKAPLIAAHRHLVLKAPHPSPLSARRGFFDCKHFSKVNGFLADQNSQPIEWSLAD